MFHCLESDESDLSENENKINKNKSKNKHIHSNNTSKSIKSDKLVKLVKSVESVEFAKSDKLVESIKFEKSNGDKKSNGEEDPNKISENSRKIKKDKNNTQSKQSNKLDKSDKINKKYVTLFSEKVDISIGKKKLINESDIVINSETKYFLMGNNGCGKTTLMKYLYEKLKDNEILMIDQDTKIESTEQTIKDFILCADIELYEKYKQMTKLEKSEYDLTEEQQTEYENLSNYVYSKNWDSYEAKSFKILNGLGFNDPDKKISLLSGGWRMRLALGRALLYEPNILFLDESSNHCDLHACIWLVDYLKTYPKTIVMITHQIGFINELAEYIWYIGDLECTGSKLYTIKGKYKNLLQFQEQTEIAITQKYEKLQKKITEMRKKTITKAEIEEVIKKAQAPRPPKKYSVNISFENIGLQMGSKNIIELRNVNFGYTSNNYILKNVELGICLQSRIVIVGDNGAGKTTLFKLCTGQILPTDGEIIKDDRIRVGHFHQLTVDNLPLEKCSIEYLKSINNDLTDDQCRAKLGKIGLKKNDDLDIPKTQIKDLSGGQKVRLSLCAIQLNSPSVILLDEPSNNLDVTSIEALITGINEFNGAIIIITHDTHLIESIENYELYQITNQTLKKFKGDFEEYKDHILS